MTTISGNKMDGKEFAKDFKPRNAIVLAPGREPVLAYESEYNGKWRFHIRKVWLTEEDEWRPSKDGVSVKLEDKRTLLDALGNMPK